MVSTTMKYSSVIRYFFHKSFSGLRKAVTNRYVLANLIYLFYECSIYIIDKGETASLPSHIGPSFAVLHCMNAVMYLWVWQEDNLSLLTNFFLPDWANLFSSLLYLTSVLIFPSNLDPSVPYYDKLFLVSCRLDLTASILDVLAIGGWYVQLYYCYRDDVARNPDVCVARGLTLDDPDIWAIATLTLAGGQYMYYNLRIALDAAHYEDYDDLYDAANFWYLVNALLYTICALRDCDVFWFMPFAGQLPDLISMAEGSEGYLLVPVADTAGLGTKGPRDRSFSNGNLSRKAREV